jgi:hypothetical protein
MTCSNCISPPEFVYSGAGIEDIKYCKVCVPYFAKKLVVQYQESGYLVPEDAPLPEVDTPVATVPEPKKKTKPETTTDNAPEAALPEGTPGT